MVEATVMAGSVVGSGVEGSAAVGWAVAKVAAGSVVGPVMVERVAVVVVDQA